jgi:hypothetical protein
MRSGIRIFALHPMALAGRRRYLCPMKLRRLATLLLAATFALSAQVGATEAGPVPTQEDVLWTGIKDTSFDARAGFFAGCTQLETRLDAQISELAARRAAMKADANTKDWDFAMKELANARSYLTGTSELATKATPESWAQDKERVGQAWLRAQAAYTKVKASTTN